MTASVPSTRRLDKIRHEARPSPVSTWPVVSGIWTKIRSAMSKPGSQERLNSNRARRRIEVAPPRLIFMTDQQSEQAVRAVAAVLLPMIRDRQQRPARQTQQEDSPDDRHCRSPSRQPVRIRSHRRGDASTYEPATHAHRDRKAPGHEDVRSHHTRPDPPIRFVFGVTVEVAGIEPASADVEPGLLRAQPAVAFLSPGAPTGRSPNQAQSPLVFPQAP